MTYDYEPECSECVHRVPWTGLTDEDTPAIAKCRLDDRIEILVYPDEMIRPDGCPLVMAEVNRAAEERIAREGIEPGIIHRSKRKGE